MLPKVEEIRRMLDGIESPAHLEVDGGIAADTIGLTRAAGATAFVAGHSIFEHSEGIVEGIRVLRDKLGLAEKN
jgi:ribulose-phosphate 3-epimerase